MFVLHRLAGGRFSPKVVLRWTKKALAYFFFCGYSISASIYSGNCSRAILLHLTKNALVSFSFVGITCL